MKATDLLKEEGYSRRKDGKYTSPTYYKGKRALAKDAALNRAAKSRGYKDYGELQRTSRTKEYKQWERWYREVQGNNKGFDGYFGRAKRAGFRPKSKSLVALMQRTTFQNGQDKGWYHGGGWQEYGWGKYH